jgi:prepilin-type N-terminal cleavage/methylation domain-containing protein
MRCRGFALTELLVVVAIIATLLALALPAIQRVRGTLARVECMNKLHQLGTALHHYHNDHSTFPPGLTLPKPGEKYPWMTYLPRVLPYIERTDLWNQTQECYRLDINPYHVPPHTPFLTVVKAFTCPLDWRLTEPQPTHQNFIAAHTSYLGCNGTNRSARDGVFFGDSRIALTDIHDGTSWTIMVGERPPSTDFWWGWWYACAGQDGTGAPDVLLGVAETNPGGPVGYVCAPGPYSFSPGRINNNCDAFKYWSLHQGGTHFMMADKSVHFFSYHGAARVLPALATRAGGEPAMLPD